MLNRSSTRLGTSKKYYVSCQTYFVTLYIALQCHQSYNNVSLIYQWSILFSVSAFNHLR